MSGSSASPSLAFSLLRYAGVTVSLGGAWAIQLLTFVLVVRLAGLHTYGIYAALMAPLAILTELGGLGAGYRLIRAVARNPTAHGEAFGQALKALALTLLPLLVAYIAFVAFGLDLQEIPWVLVAALGASEVTCTRLISWAEHTTIAHGSYREANVVRLVFPVLRLLVFAASPLFLVMSLEWLLGLSAMVNIVASGALMLWIAVRFGRPSGRFSWSELRHGVPFALSEVTRAAQGNIDRVVISLVAAAPVLALYVISGRILQLAMFPVTALLSIVYPSYFKEGGLAGVKGTFGMALRIAPPVGGLALVGAVGIYLVADFIPLLLGAEFQDAVPLIRTMLWVVLPMGLASVAADALSGADMQPTRLWLYASSVVFQTVVLLLLVPPFGLQGAVVALYSGAVFYCAILWTVLYFRGRRT